MGLEDGPIEYPTAMASRIASRFWLPSPVEALDFPERGNINLHTYLVAAGRPTAPREFLLQRINEQVFTRPRSVMSAMMACIEAQKQRAGECLHAPDEEWQAIELVPLRTGEPYLEHLDRRGPGVWRLMVKIPEARTYKSLGEIEDPEERLFVAREAGRGLAIYTDLTASMDIAGLENPLPGYRDTRIYYSQLRSVLAGNRSVEDVQSVLPADPVVRQSTERHFLVHVSPAEFRRRVEDPELARFIALARDSEEFGLTLLREMENGGIRRGAIHGDTKLDNFLFSTRTGRVKALVDLDTIMPHTWLADWGDMVRSLCNVAGEKERDIGGVQVDRPVYQAVTEGFLGATRGASEREIALMTAAVQIIALELGVRFLSDYLRGDSYFRLGPADAPDLNKVRAMVQLTLFERLRACDDWARDVVLRLSAARASEVPGCAS